MVRFGSQPFLTGTVHLLDLASLTLAAISKGLALLLKVAAHLASHQFITNRSSGLSVYDFIWYYIRACRTAAARRKAPGTDNQQLTTNNEAQSVLPRDLL